MIKFILYFNIQKKSDLNQNQNDAIVQYTLYHLRKYCAAYGASLIYTSSKNQENVSSLYEYILHVFYGFAHRNKYEIYNYESIFIPTGSDNLSLIKQSNPTIDESKPFEEVVKKSANKTQKQEEVVCEDEQEFLKSLLTTNKLSAEPPSNNRPIIQSNYPPEQTRASTGTNQTQQVTNVTNFYQKLLQKPERLRENAERDLMSRANLFRNEEIQQVKDIIKKPN